jgi:hypothetical protein
MDFPSQDRHKSNFWNTVTCSEYQTMGKDYKPNNPKTDLILILILIFCKHNQLYFCSAKHIADIQNVITSYTIKSYSYLYLVIYSSQWKIFNNSFKS